MGDPIAVVLHFHDRHEGLPLAVTMYPPALGCMPKGGDGANAGDHQSSEWKGGAPFRVGE